MARGLGGLRHGGTVGAREHTGDLTLGLPTVCDDFFCREVRIARAIALRDRGEMEKVWVAWTAMVVAQAQRDPATSKRAEG